MKSSHSYVEVPSENDSELLHSCHHCENGSHSRSGFKIREILALEAFHVLLLLLAYAAYATLQGRTSNTGFDNYLELQDYNASANHGLRDAADATLEAAEFWKDVQSTNGIIAFDAQRVGRMNLPTTRSHPSDPDLKIYQINFFHSLHCLYRIRSRLLSTVPIDRWPRNDSHTLHCLDHVRHSLMCHPDLSLHGTDDYVVFDNVADDRKCRDTTAVQRWTQAHAWSGYKQIWDRFDWADVEGRIEEELKTHPGIRWDQYRDYYDPELPHGYRLEFLDD